MDIINMDDFNLLEWNWQYGGMQAGYYPGMRKTRVKVEQEIRRRGLTPLPMVHWSDYIHKLEWKRL